MKKLNVKKIIIIAFATEIIHKITKLNLQYKYIFKKDVIKMTKAHNNIA